jgi:hypothetical protein
MFANEMLSAISLVFQIKQEQVSKENEYNFGVVTSWFSSKGYTTGSLHSVKVPVKDSPS